MVMVTTLHMELTMLAVTMPMAGIMMIMAPP
jgi:hypothetical protein